MEPRSATVRAAHALAAHLAAMPQVPVRTIVKAPAAPSVGATVRRTWSEKYPPVGQTKPATQSNVVGFEHGGGTLNLNCIRIEHQARVGFSWMANFEPCATSVLSALPSFIYHTAEVSVPLTRSEIGRLLRFSLSRGEYFRLVEKFGVFFEICPFFYDEVTGEALHPVKGDTADERQRHTQILSLTPGAIPPPEPGHLPEDLVAYLKGEAKSISEAAPAQNDPRPFVLVLVNGEGVIRAHSIMNQAAAFAFLDEVKARPDTKAFAIPLVDPAEMGSTDPFDNFVVICTRKGGGHQAFGRFASRKDANRFVAKPESVEDYADFTIASVTSSYLGSTAAA